MKKRRSKADLLGLPTRNVDYGLAGGAYEGASLFDREVAMWSPTLNSADADIIPSRGTAMARSRDIIRNDSFVASGETIHKDTIVGAEYLLNCAPDLRALGMKDDEEWETEFQEEVESKFSLYAESPDCWIDASRKLTLTGLVRLAVGVSLSAGEVLASAEWIRRVGRPYKTAIQMIENERLSNPFGGNAIADIRDGVRVDRYGAPISYFIRNSHPSDISIQNPQAAWNWTEYPAYTGFGRNRIIHIIDNERIDQTRGISGIVSALKEMKTTKKFRDVMLQNAVVNATFAASVETDNPASVDTIVGTDVDPYFDWAADYLTAVNQYSGGFRGLQIDGVKIPHLFPGQKLQLRPAGQGGPLGTEFEAALLRYIAAALNVSYEELSRDYSQSNYSSMRAALNQTWKAMSSRKKLIADRFATLIFRLWFEEAVNMGQLETMKGRPDFYEGMNRDAYTKCTWLGAARGMIDEMKETQAALARVQGNLSTLEIELGRQGIDWRKGLRQKAREQTMLKKLGLLMPEADPETQTKLLEQANEPTDDSQPAKKPAKKGA